MSIPRKTQKQMFYAAHRQIADRDRAFMEMLTGPNPITPETIDVLIERRPERYGRYAKFGAKAKKGEPLRTYSDPVTRYVPTYVNAAGERTLMRAAQGRDTFATEAEAQAWIAAVTANNSADAVRQIWGSDPKFEVRACPCWPGHFDPQTVWFD